MQTADSRLVDLFATLPPDVELVAKIHEVENACDTITHDTLKRLNQTFFTPIDREDVYALAKVLDDVMDAIDDSSARVPMHRVCWRVKVRNLQINREEKTAVGGRRSLNLFIRGEADHSPLSGGTTR